MIFSKYLSSNQLRTNKPLSEFAIFRAICAILMSDEKNLHLIV